MGQAFLHGNGGSNPLNFKVVASSTAPSSPKENTVWVKTSIAMPYWTTASSDAIPTWNAVQGNVVFWWKGVTSTQVNSTTSAGFMAVKYNSVKGNFLLTPTSCYQQVDTGTAKNWKSMNAYIYKSGAWVQFSSEFAATIKVTYPSGSTLTCTDGTTTLKATTTTGSYTFTVPNAGTWTVKAVSGSSSASKSVSITASGQSASVTLSYTVYLYNAGDACTNVTGGWEGTGDDTSSALVVQVVHAGYNGSNSDYGEKTTKSKVAIPGGAKSLKITYSTSGDWATLTNRPFGLKSSGYVNGEKGVGNFVTYKTLEAGTNVTVTLDISGNAGGSYYIAVKGDSGTSNKATNAVVTISKIWIE